LRGCWIAEISTSASGGKPAGQATGSVNDYWRSEAELRQALANPDQLPLGELDNAVEFHDESEETFLRRLWRDLYGDEPI